MLYEPQCLSRVCPHSRCDPQTQLVGPNIELFSKGQVFFKEGGYGKSGSNPKYMHQVCV